MTTSNTNRIITEPTEVLQVGDTVKVLDSPIDRIKKSAKGRVVSVHGDFAKDNTVMVTVNFRVAKEDFPIFADSKRFAFQSHNEVDELPDAENASLEDEDETPEVGD